MAKTETNDHSYSDEQLRCIIKEVFHQEVLPLLRPHAFTTSKPLTRNEAATYLGISLVTLHNWTMRGIVKATRVSTRVRYYKEDLDKALVYIQTETGNRA